MSNSNIPNDYSWLRLGDTLSDGEQMLINLAQSVNRLEITVTEVEHNKPFIMKYDSRTQTYEGNGYVLHAYIDFPNKKIMANTIKQGKPFLHKIV